MFNDRFYNRTLRHLIIGFGKLFSDIVLQRYETSGNPVTPIKVPIAYAPKQKYVVRQTQDPNNDKQVQIQYPRISYILTTWKRATDAQLNPLGQITCAMNGEGERFNILNPIIYDIGFDLYLIADNYDDILQLTEGIVPYFPPQYNLVIKSLEAPEIKDTVPIVLDEVVPVIDNWDGPLDDLRKIVQTIKFTAKSVKFYRGNPTDQTQAVIRKVTSDFHIMGEAIKNVDLAEDSRDERVTVALDPLDAAPTDDYDVSVSIEEFFDGKIFNPVTGVDDDPPET